MSGFIDKGYYKCTTGLSKTEDTMPKYLPYVITDVVENSFLEEQRHFLDH